MRTAFETVAVAFSMFSALPMPRVAWKDSNMRYALCAFPLVGLAIGSFQGFFIAKLKVPPTYKIPVFIGIGCAAPNETALEQNAADLDKQLHYGRWK